jgi:type IV secretion system protein VirD4
MPVRDKTAQAAVDSSQRFETIALACAAAVVIMTACVLAGAHLATHVAGNPPLRAGLVDAAVATVRLPAHVGDPATAWTPVQAAALPTAGPYYGCLSVTIAVATAVTGLAVRTWRSVGRVRHPLGVEPHAGLARPRDLRRLTVRQSLPGRLTLGRVGGRLVAAEPQASLAVVGPTGCGKSAGFAIPALLEWDGPVIATSVKTDLLHATLARRRAMGRVWIFDPTGATPHQPARWSPLATCSSWHGAIRMAAWLTEAAKGRLQSVTDEEYWMSQARKALAPHLYAAAVSGATMRDVVRWIDAQEQDRVRLALQRQAGVLDEVERALGGADADDERRQLEPHTRADIVDQIRQVLRADAGRRAELADQRVIHWPLDMQEQLDERIANEVETRLRRLVEAKVVAAARSRGDLDALVSVESLWAQEDRLRGSIYATVQNVLLVYTDPQVADATSAAEVDIDEWLAGSNTIFVVATADEQDRLRPALTVLIQQAVRRAYEVANSLGGSLARPCLLLLDEAGNIAPLRDLPSYAATARSHGISVVSIWQDLAQIRALYGNRAQVVINNHRAKIFGSDNDDPDTLEFVSRLVGDSQFIERNYSADVTGSGRRSVSEHTTYRRAVPLDVLRRLRRGNALLIYGSQLPAHLELRPWYDDRRLRALAGVRPEPADPS